MLSDLVASVPVIDAATRDPLERCGSPLYRFCTECPAMRNPLLSAKTRPSNQNAFRNSPHASAKSSTKHGTDGAFYGHASVGCLHIRPVLNIHEETGVATMRKIMEDVTDLVLEFNGSLSGEHGDGLARSERNKKMFGPGGNEASPPREAAASTPATCWIRARWWTRRRWKRTCAYRRATCRRLTCRRCSITRNKAASSAVSNCATAGVCRKTQGGAMCPSYRATKDRKGHDSRTRERAAVGFGRRRGGLRALLPQRGDLGREEFASFAHGACRWIMEVMDLAFPAKRKSERLAMWMSRS